MVEVLISMAIVSMILGGAYVTSNKSLISIRDAQEHVDALKLATAEVELIKAITPPTSGTFCYSLDGIVQYVQSNCNFTNEGVLNTTGVQPSYNIVITPDVFSTYKVKITWDTVTGVINGGNVEVYYRSDR